MYIRTKNKIYETESPFLDNNGKWVGYNIVEDDMAIILRIQVIREADTLEELCDLFIDEETKTIFHKHNGYVINWKTNMVYSLKELAKSFHSVKGAIYTDDGLIYVAKMDSDGKLVLI